MICDIKKLVRNELSKLATVAIILSILMVQISGPVALDVQISS